MPFRYVRWVVKTPKDVKDLKLTSTSGRAQDSPRTRRAAV